MARADPGDGGGPDGPPMDDARVVESADPPAALGSPPAERATAQGMWAPQASRSMTTVQWGATRWVKGGGKPPLREHCRFPVHIDATLVQGRDAFGSPTFGSEHVAKAERWVTSRASRGGRALEDLIPSSKRPATA